jgi:hypothetical protein
MKQLTDAQKKAAARAFVTWLSKQAKQLQRWRVRKTPAGWVIYRPRETRPFAVFPTHAQAMAALKELA